MSAELVSEIKKIRELIVQRPRIFRSGKKREDNVRDNLVFPLLHRLGWNSPPYIAIKEMEVKLKNSKGEIDITLSKNDTNLLAFEVKRLGARVDINSDATKQLADYLIALRINLGITTDGKIWNLYRFQAWDSDLIWSVDLVDMSPEECAVRLAQIDNKNIEKLENQIELRIKKQEAMKSAWDALWSDKHKQITTAARVLLQEVSTTYKNLDFQLEDTTEYLSKYYPDASMLSEIHAPRRVRLASTGKRKSPESSTPPKTILIGSEEYEGLSVYRILTSTAEWLISNGHLTKNDCPLKVTKGKVRYLVNSEPVHETGKRFTAPKRLSNKLFIETSYNLGNTEEMARRLLETFGYSRDLLRLEF